MQLTAPNNSGESIADQILAQMKQEKFETIKRRTISVLRFIV